MHIGMTDWTSVFENCLILRKVDLGIGWVMIKVGEWKGMGV